jgi:hypothetical protein
VGLKRRDLTASQRAMIGDKLREMYDMQAKERQAATRKRGVENPVPVILPERGKGDARDLAGAAVGVSGSLMDAARKVRSQGVPELAQAVEERRMGVTRAAALAAQPEDVQRQEAAKPAPRRGPAGPYRTAYPVVVPPRSGRPTATSSGPAKFR